MTIIDINAILGSWETDHLKRAKLCALTYNLLPV